MRVLVACEYSGVVRDAFLRRGHDAMSCDLLPTEAHGPHHQGDVRDILSNGWDLMVAHPPCTYLSVSGMHWTVRGKRDPQLTEDALEFVRLLMNAPIERIAIENPVSVISSRIRKPDQAIQPWWFGEDASKKTCLWLKNLPVLEMQESQVVSPNGWERVRCAAEMSLCACCEEPFCELHRQHYGECECIGPDEEGVTIRSVDKVMFATRQSPPPRMIWGNQTSGGQNKLGPSPDRWKIRSRTYWGIAEAMAEQWGSDKLCRPTASAQRRLFN